MFGWFKKDPLETLNKEYQLVLKQAMESQRNGNIRLYAELTEKAESIRANIVELQASQESTS